MNLILDITTEKITLTLLLIKPNYLYSVFNHIISLQNNKITDWIIIDEICKQENKIKFISCLKLYMDIRREYSLYQLSDMTIGSKYDKFYVHDKKYPDIENNLNDIIHFIEWK